jgi:hypothetical protein
MPTYKAALVDTAEGLEQPTESQQRRIQSMLRASAPDKVVRAKPAR